MNTTQNNKSKITLSLDSLILDDLKKEAESQETSVNAKINTILTKYTFFHRYSEEQESLLLLDSVVLEYLDMIEEKEFIKILNPFAAEIISTIFRQNNIEMTLNNIIKHFFQNIALWAGMYKSFKFFKINSQTLSLIFEHKYGIKWSRIAGTSLCYFIETELNHPTKLQTLHNSIVITVEIK